MFQSLISVATVDILSDDPVNLTVTEGDQTTLTCTARGVPAPEVMWYRGSELINGSDTRLQVNSSDPILNATTDIYYKKSKTLKCRGIGMATQIIKK